MKILNKIQALIGIVLLTLSLQVNAIPITGEIGMIGAFNPVDSNWKTTNFSGATGIDFNPDMFKVAAATGSFSTITIGTIGDITDFQFDPFPGPIIDFWRVDGFSFDLVSISKGFTSNPTNKLVLEGIGTISADNFTDTQGTWTFTGQTTLAGGVFTWSAGTTAQVPEPGILTLLGIGLLGFAGRGIRKKI